MNERVKEHALRYAIEKSKVFLMNEYKTSFPHLFEDAYLETRPATDEDYFVPPSLASECIVVKGTRFGETACNRISCYPYKQNWEPCGEGDDPQWIHVGGSFQLACQPSCADLVVTTEWSDGKCKIANPSKIQIASMPEKLLGRTGRHSFNGGLDLVNGKLQANKRYCDSYGLDYASGHCDLSTLQNFGEWLFGVTTIRGIKAARIAPFQPQHPPIPGYLNYQFVGKKKRYYDDPKFQEISREILIELAADIGKDVSEWAVERFLKKKAPKLLNKTIDTLAARLVLKHSITTSMKQMGSAALKSIKSAFGTITMVYSIYELSMDVLDAVDPYDFQSVLTKDTLEKIDRELDYMYFKDGEVRPELTPEYIWENGLLKEDESSKLEFMVEKVEEYLNAIQAIPPNEYLPKMDTVVPLFVWKDKRRRSMKGLAIFILMCVALLFINWIHFWSVVLFFLLCFWHQ